jgi:cullin 4
VSKIVLLPIAEEDDMIPQLLAFKSFVDSLLTDAFREDAKVQYDDAVPAKQELGKGKRKASSSTNQKKRGKGPFGYAATDAFARGFGKRQRKPAEMIGLLIYDNMPGDLIS